MWGLLLFLGMRIFKDYIGLKSCTSGTPRSNFWINQMAGVSLKSLDKISNSEDKTFSATWDNIQERSCLMINEGILDRLNRRIIMPIVKDQLQFGLQPQTLTINPSSNDFVGIKIYGIQDRYERVQLTSFSCYSNSIVNDAEFFVYDLNKGLLIKTITTDLVVGFNSVFVDLEIENNGNLYPNYFLCYDNSDFQLNQTQASYQDDCSMQSTGFVNGYSVSCVGAINTGKQTNIKANVTSVSNTWGLILDFNQKCSLDEFISPIIDRFKLAWAYLLLSEIVQETKLSERFNLFTTEYTIEEFNAMYDHYINEYNKYMDIAFKNMIMPTNGCFCNNERFQQIHARP
jgi:hypothetical protein